MCYAGSRVAGSRTPEVPAAEHDCTSFESLSLEGTLKLMPVLQFQLSSTETAALQRITGEV